ncbi:MAG: DNA-binding transcriptional regulator [bacterium]
MHTYKIALIIEKSRAYGRAICEGIAAYAHQQGNWELHLLDEMSTDKALRQLKEVDGVIARILKPKTLAALRTLKVPIVDVFGGERYSEIGLVDSDHQAVGRLAAECFLMRRFQRFAFCGYPGIHFSDLREKGFAESVEAKGFSCHRFPMTLEDVRSLTERIIRHEKIELDEHRKQLAQWLKLLPKPISIFCCHDIRSYQLATLCKHLHIRVPQEVAILGVDDDRILCGFSSPMLSSIDPDAVEIGRQAAELLATALASQGKFSRIGTAKKILLVPPKQLVERASTEVYPLEPAWLSEIMIFIQRNYMRNISAEDIFKLAKRSHTIVERTFQKVLATTVRKEIIRARMAESARLLQSTELSSCKISGLVGFTNPQYFNRSFRVTYKMTPETYRKQRKLGETGQKG